MILGVWAQSALLVGCGLVAAGCAPSRWHQVTLSGTMQDRAGRPWPDANVILRPVPSPVDSATRARYMTRTDASGRFRLRVRLARGCYGLLLIGRGSDAVDWHIWVDRSRTYSLGTVQIAQRPFTAEGLSHVVAGCGVQDTLRPIGGWEFDTLQVAPT